MKPAEFGDFSSFLRFRSFGSFLGFGNDGRVEDEVFENWLDKDGRSLKWKAFLDWHFYLRKQVSKSKGFFTFINYNFLFISGK